ncbi:fused response regulator/phosphatase [Marinobacterium zhoushanense]|uniref:Fused response regulator/phosphatase n=1 Tax=Marinobacterium zhoushanense TaxID=1679163 RepID=A0ABQ1KEM5_9GAMM|nr:response regulator [Marinobacterium zhoushanense]GGB96638.1 fused response regulator/phosphatase [Marinobacterium zhoushanense]
MSAPILIVDDDRAVRDLFARYLRTLGYLVETSAEGSEVLEACHQALPALVLCDLRMPGHMDGIELLEALRRRYEALPVIVVSGTGEMHDAIQALKLGASDFLTKPLPDLEVLRHAVERALERSRLIEENRNYRQYLERANSQLERSLGKIREDESAGRRVQFALMPPQRQRFGEYECSHHIKSSSLLSGDFVDYFAIDRDRFAFYMVDVSGHGISSALITVMVKHLMSRYLENFRRYRDGRLLDPAALLEALNGELLQGDHGKYLTMFYAIVDTKKCSLTYGIGGQYPFPYCFDGDQVEVVGDRSPPVGLFDEASYTCAKRSIGERFSLTLYSDGVLDTLPQADLHGCKEHLASVAARDDRDAEALAVEIGLVECNSLPDDASILSIRRISANG